MTLMIVIIINRAEAVTKDTEGIATYSMFWDREVGKLLVNVFHYIIQEYIS